MDMPKPVEEHEKLSVFEGYWEGEETLFPSPWDPKGGSGMGLYVNKMDLEGFVLIIDYCQNQDGAVTYRGHGVFGWDSRQSHYLMHWSDSMSGIAPQVAAGTWKDNVLQFQDQSEMGHARYTYEIISDTEFAFSLDHSRDGQDWSRFMQGRYSKK